MIAENGMSAVTVNKVDLLKTLSENREAHTLEYAEAKEGYRQKVIEQMKENLAKAEAGGELEILINLQAPENHTKDYDKVIRMLQMSVNETVVITEHEFSQYVLDEWGWSARTKMVNSSYAVGQVRGHR